jgi:cytochrome c556
MFIMGQNLNRIGAMAQGRVPFDAKVAADSAAVVEFASKLPWAAFPEGSDKGAPNKANMAEIMKDKQKFAELSEKLQAESAKLSVAAKTGSLDNIKGALGGVGSTCKGCHDSFQNK